MCRAAMLMFGLKTEAPPRAPREMLMSPSDSRIRMASRSVGRETPNRVISSPSAASESPSLRGAANDLIAQLLGDDLRGLGNPHRR